MITVEELVAIDALKLTYFGGETGGHRYVSWAHVCDLADPWNWVNPGDLVMTTGAGLPSPPEAQKHWVERVAQARVSGVVLARAPDNPEPTEAMREAAGALNFPVLTADFDLHFVELARTVIGSAIKLERERVSRMTRLYDYHLHNVQRGVTSQEQFEALARVARCKAWVRDTGTRRLLLTSNETAVPPGAFPESGGERIGDSTRLLIDLRTRPPAQLLAESLEGSLLEPGILQHLASLLALDLEQAARDRDALRASGSEFLTALLDGRLNVRGLWPTLKARGIEPPLVLTVWARDDDSVLADDSLHHHLAFHDSVPLVSHRPPLLYAVLPDKTAVLGAFRSYLGDGISGGVSDLRSESDIEAVVTEARLALTRARETGVSVCRQQDALSDAGLLPRTLGESKRIVRRILGPVIQYDSENGTQLLETLRTFLANDRSWSRTASKMNVHRQTIVYRLQRVELLTGRKASTTADSSSFWLALCILDGADLQLEEVQDGHSGGA